MRHGFAGFDLLPEAREAVKCIGRFVREGIADESGPRSAVKEFLALGAFR